MSLVRIFSVDFYMNAPRQGLDVTYSEFRGACVYQVPIIRIFGTSENGVKTCLHVHGVFPYIYIPFEGVDYPNSTMYQVASKLDQALNTSLGQTTSNTQHIYSITLVSGIPFYGYHHGEHQFLKIYFYNPLVMKRACNLLQSGSVFGKVYQPHEAHIPFILQFMIDYNLHGMNYISVSQVQHRRDPMDISSSPADLLAESAVSKISTCASEMDALAEHIVNRFELFDDTGGIKNPGIASLWDEEKQRLRNKGIESQISPCLTQTRINISPTESHEDFSDRLREKLRTDSGHVDRDKRLDNLVYPAPTPGTGELLPNASIVQFHSASGSSSSSNIERREESNVDLGERTLDFNDSWDLSQFRDDKEAREFLKVLRELGDNVDVEDGSILSQTTKHSEESEEEDDGEADLSIAMESQTPTKLTEENCGDMFDGDITLKFDDIDECSNDVNQSQKNTIDAAKRKLQFLDETPNIKFSEKINVSVEKRRNLNLSLLRSDERFFEELQLSPSETQPTIANKYDESKSFVPVAGTSNVLGKNQNHLTLSEESDSLTPEFFCSGRYVEGKSQSLSQHENTHCFVMTQNLTILEVDESSIDTLTASFRDFSVWMPKYNPPSRETIVDTLGDYDIPAVRHQEPFYGDHKHAGKEVQVGQRFLKISSALDLPQFESSSDCLISLRQAAIIASDVGANVTTSKQFEALTATFLDDTECILMTARDPPTRHETLKWLNATNRSEDVANEHDKFEKVKIKINAPRSPGAQSDEDDSSDESLCLSPLSVSTASQKSSSSITPSNSQQENKFGKKVRSKLSQSRKDKFDASTLRRNLLNCQLLNKSDSISSNNSCQITGASLDNTHGFKMSLENLRNAKAVSECQHLTVLAAEVHVSTRADFRPDPQLDPIRAIFYSVYQDVPDQNNRWCGVIAVDVLHKLLDGTGGNFKIEYVNSENELVDAFLALIGQLDPDIFVGYETELLSWGYLIERGYVLGFNLKSTLARSSVKLNFSEDENYSDTKFPGRILLDAWRLMKSEIALQSYTFENVMYHVLHRRIPLYSFKDLSFWWELRSSTHRHRTVSFYLTKVDGILRILDQLDFYGRTGELARLFGIQFYEVLSRGSQFRVESMMLRLAKPLNYVAVSPSIQQRARMKAPEWIPLVMEPESKFYTDPVIVLDFQSLYPSIIIAYNYCFSTCLGKIEYLAGTEGSFEFGATHLQVSRSRLRRLVDRNLLNFSPCGVAFVKPKIREGVMPRMLTEILETRLMVKKAMKQNKTDKVLQRVLHNRQLGLKLIANVTYGYTAANFSGRMPAVEVGDSVVSKGRETLLRAIKMIESTSRWGARVVYGDTDSIFVLVRGKSRDEAFRIGTEIADAVTNDNPSPIKLKLEKVFHPCILQTKKRYVGYMYESAEQIKPEFCAKGIETVRRDGCPAASKMLEKCLKLLFDTRDVSLVRIYVERQFTKLLSGRFNLQDLIFAKEYRGASNYRPGACVPALELTRKWTAIDKRREPRCGERVPYVIINGPPGLPLIKLVRCPIELLENPNLLPNVLYYITRAIIPVLNRCFLIIGADVNIWFNSLPRKQMNIPTCVTPDSKHKKQAISDYFFTAICLACNTRRTQKGICDNCLKSPQQVAIVLQNKTRLWEKANYEVNLICQSCCGYPVMKSCASLDCPVMYTHVRTSRDAQQVVSVRQLLTSILE